MKRLSKEDINYYINILEIITNIVILIAAITFLVFVWLSTKHIEDILDFLATKIPY